ncbi:hypothetical protein LPJGGPFB_01079 [Ensifer adhaerens]|nr:hypothetical protein [Ensifer adhaerens]NRP17852.1 hypothetical protein [Ensifer adhaerens]
MHNDFALPPDLGIAVAAHSGATVELGQPLAKTSDDEVLEKVKTQGVAVD